LVDSAASLTLIDADDEALHLQELEIPKQIASDLFARNGRVKRIELELLPSMLLAARD